MVGFLCTRIRLGTDPSPPAQDDVNGFVGRARPPHPDVWLPRPHTFPHRPAGGSSRAWRAGSGRCVGDGGDAHPTQNAYGAEDDKDYSDLINSVVLSQRRSISPGCLTSGLPWPPLHDHDGVNHAASSHRRLDRPPEPSPPAQEDLKRSSHGEWRMESGLFSNRVGGR
jgi:hypothetical protein